MCKVLSNVKGFQDRKTNSHGWLHRQWVLGIHTYNATTALTAISSEKTGEVCVPLVANTTFKILPLPAKHIYLVKDTH